MLNKGKILIILLICFCLGSSQGTYKKIYPKVDPEAKCLDGSPGIIYTHQGSQKDKIFIFAYGGGTCAEETLSDSLQSCYQRSKTILGSSNFWPEQIIGTGYLSTDPAKNKFANWTKILFPYCDGVIHQGYRKQSIVYKGVQLFFRGAAITRQNFKWIDQQFNLSASSKIVITGMSAGGVFAFHWVNYLRSMVKQPSIISTIVDSGLFVDSISYISHRHIATNIAKTLTSIANVDEKSPLTLCNQRYVGQQWKCLLLQYAFTAVDGRILLIDSQYDAWQYLYYNEFYCPTQSENGFTLSKCNSTELSYAQSVRKLRTNFIYGFTLFSKNSVWSIACSNHVYVYEDKFYNSQNQKVPMNTGYTVQEAVQRFVFNQERIGQIDNVNWPNNKPCA